VRKSQSNRTPREKESKSSNLVIKTKDAGDINARLKKRVDVSSETESKIRELDRLGSRWEGEKGGGRMTQQITGIQ